MGLGSPRRPSLRSHGELLDAADTCCWRSHADLGTSRGQPRGKAGTWQDQAWGRTAPQRPNSGSLQLLLAARASGSQVHPPTTFHSQGGGLLVCESRFDG